MTPVRYNVIYTSYRASELNHIPNIGRFNQIYLHTHTLSSTKCLYYTYCICINLYGALHIINIPTDKAPICFLIFII